MEDVTSQDPQDTEAMVEAQPQVSPPQNGNGNGHLPTGIQKQITEKYTVPAGYSPASLTGRFNNRPPYQETKKAVADRDFLEELMIKPESNDYQLAINRYQPSTDAEGNEVPRGMLYSVPVMYYDDLVNEVANAWGGGAYRVTVTDKNGGFIDSIRQCVIVQIPTTQHPPKHSKYEKIDPVRKTAAAPDEPVISENAARLKQIREESALRREEERLQREREADDDRREEYELKKLRKQKELQTLRDAMLNPRKDSDDNALEKRLEDIRRDHAEALKKMEEDRREERRVADERRKEDQQRHEAQMAEERRRHEEDRRILSEQLNRLTERLNQPAPVQDNSMKDIMMGLIASTIGKTPPPPPPDNSKELVIELNKANQQVISALAQKPGPDPNDAKMFSIFEKMIAVPKSDSNMQLMQTLITALVGGKNEKLTPQAMMELIKMGKDDAKEMMEMIHGIAPQTATGETEDEWDPKAGFLGNAGKAIFNMLKQTVQAASSNPQMMQAITQMFGKRQPSDYEIAQRAAQMEHGIVPALNGPVYQPMDQQLIPYQPQPMMQPQQPQQQPARGPRPIPNTQQAQAQQPQQPVANSQQQIVNELESEAGGLPTNADPEPQTPEQLAQENLRFNVTEAMEIMLKELEQKAKERTWPKYAHQTWNQTFKSQLVNETIEQRRVVMIAQQCDAKVWQDVQLALSDAVELAAFYTGLRKFIDMNSGGPMPAEVVTPTQPAPAAPAATTPAAVI